MGMIKNKRSVGFFFLVLWFLTSGVLWAAELPEGFVYLDDQIPDIQLDLRYLSADNFVGKPIDGYVKPRAIVTREAAEALKKVQADLKAFGLGLKLFDAYRPQSAVDEFVRWGKDLSDLKMKDRYYPEVEKKDLFLEGYIADRSSHSRGSTVDVTLIATDGSTVRELDMGTGFDLFSPKSWPDNRGMTPSQRAQRMLLQALMVRHGFNPYPQEWWHFTLAKEPFPGTFYNFPVE
jgi:D-alanyl-D-alanine dipeptidase